MRICTSPTLYLRVSVIYWPVTPLRTTQQGQPRPAGLASISSPRMQSLLFQNQHCGSDRGGPLSAPVAHRRLRNVAGANDLVGDAVDLLFLVPALVRVEFHVQGG